MQSAPGTTIDYFNMSAGFANRSGMIEVVERRRSGHIGLCCYKFTPKTQSSGAGCLINQNLCPCWPSLVAGGFHRIGIHFMMILNMPVI
eukprot:9268932-Pyramimonas_sp.AAC.1